MPAEVPLSSIAGGPVTAPLSTPRRTGIGRLSILAVLILGAVGAMASRIQGVQTKPTDEISTHDVETPFKLQAERNLVLVRVVVRDAKGNAVGNLSKDDFEVYDRGNLQDILHFSVEKSASNPASNTDGKSAAPGLEMAQSPTSTPPAPLRFVALFFDDLHTSLDGLQTSRNAADHYLATSLGTGDRVGLFTASGQGQVDFTGDLAKVHQALFDLRARPAGSPGEACVDIPPFQAYLILKRQPDALDEAKEEAKCKCYNQECSRGDTAFKQTLQNRGSSGAVGGGQTAEYKTTMAMAEEFVSTEAYRKYQETEDSARSVLRSIGILVKAMTMLPGQRSVVIVSGGFLTLTLKTDLDDLAERALRAHVILNALDARGLYTGTGLVETQEMSAAYGLPADIIEWRKDLNKPSAALESEGMVTLADETGGVFFENSNDFEAGFQRLAGVPNAYYVLAFSPQNLKLDGAFHALKVKLVSPRGLTIQARKGYYAPRYSVDPAVREKEEMKEAIFSQEEEHTLPVDVHTQFFMKSRSDAQLDVLTHFDIHQMHFRKQADLNLDNLTCTTALFDRNGHLVVVMTRSVQMKLRDQTLAAMLRTGATLRTRFDVKPGTYFVRTVLRDSESGQLSSLNSTVEIPF
jgi:VWFA-related protein